MPSPIRASRPLRYLRRSRTSRLNWRYKLAYPRERACNRNNIARGDGQFSDTREKFPHGTKTHCATERSREIEIVRLLKKDTITFRITIILCVFLSFFFSRATKIILDIIFLQHSFRSSDSCCSMIKFVDLFEKYIDNIFK